METAIRNHVEALEAFEAAQSAVRDGEARGLGKSAMGKRWRAYFAAEDRLKAIDRGAPWS